jgi:hypothetical protein
MKKILKLRRWIEQNKRIPMRSKYSTQEEKLLGLFCSKVRQIYAAMKNNTTFGKMKNLSIDEINVFDNIKEWRWIINDRIIKIQELIKWIKDNNRLPIQSKYKSKDEQKIAKFATKLRRIYNSQIIEKEIPDNYLTEDEIKLFDDVKIWKWNFKDARLNQIKELKAWVDANKRLPNKRSKNEEEKKLGGFVQRLRKIYKAMQNNIKIDLNPLNNQEMKLVKSIRGIIV